MVLLYIRFPFCFRIFKTINVNLIKLSDYSDRYIEVFRNLTDGFHFVWKDAILLLNPILYLSENLADFQATERLEDEQGTYYSQSKSMKEKKNLGKGRVKDKSKVQR